MVLIIIIINLVILCQLYYKDIGFPTRGSNFEAVGISVAVTSIIYFKKFYFFRIAK